jgi:two-component system, NarL family, sensor kinase
VGPSRPPVRPPRRRLESRTDELEVLSAIAEALNRSSDVQQALERTLSLVARLLGLRTGWVWLLDPDTAQFYLAAAQQLPPYLKQPVRMTGHACWCIEEFQGGSLTPRNIDVIECSRLRPAVKQHAVHLTQGLRYHASIPLYFQQKPLGIINVTGPSWRKLTGDELRLLSTIADQVGIAIDRARLADQSAQGARAEERARIAREIHDTLVQGLTAIGLNLEGALAQLADSPERARERLQRALDVSRESLEEARRSVLDLRAMPLAGRPLGEALAALGRRFTSETGIRVHVRAPAESSFAFRVEAELLRITQEALANVRRHARAGAVEIRLSRLLGRLTLSIRDDGQGFRARRAPGSGVGILGMQERARVLGGGLRVTSRPGHGTTVRASIPLGARAAG